MVSIIFTMQQSIHRAFRPSSARGPLSVAGTVCFDSRAHGGSAPRILTELDEEEALHVLATAAARPNIACLPDSHAYFIGLQQDFPGTTRGYSSGAESRLPSPLFCQRTNWLVQ